MRRILALIACLGIMFISGCKPSVDQIRAILEKNPDVVFNIIEQNPEKFMEVVNNAFQKAQLKEREKAQADLEAAREKEFKEPKKPNIESSRAIRGNPNAPITIVEYTDIECPYCARGHQVIRSLEEKYKDKIRVVFKHLPLEFHEQALPAAQWFEAIAMQNPQKAYEFSDVLFQNQDKLGVEFYKATAKALGLDVAKIESDIKSDKIKTRIEADKTEAKEFEFTGTPGFLINGVSIRGAMPQAEFEKVIDRLLGTAPQAAPKGAPAAPAHPDH